MLALASDLTDRGLQYGPRRPVLQGELSALVDGRWAASLSGSVQGDSSPSHFAGARLSRYWTLSNDWEADAALSWYDHRHDPIVRYRYAEAGASVAFRDVLSLGLSTRNYTQWPGHLRWAVDTGLRWPIAGDWSVNGNVGWAQLPTYDGKRYRYSGAGIGWQRNGWSAGLSRIGADSTARTHLGSSARPHWSAFIAKDF